MARINRGIELLEQGLPVFVQHPPAPPPLTRESGRAMAEGWADVLIVELEHASLDVPGLAAFMQGLKEAGGARPPAVVVSMPGGARSVADVRANAWQTRQVLATGVHGLMQPHALDAEAVEHFVAACRYVVHDALGKGAGLPSGFRGGGGEASAAAVWGMSAVDYIERAEPWPLNPEGELLLGLKIEDRAALESADAIAAVPGIAFAEWGPFDMGLSFGHRAAVDPPYPPEMQAACDRVRAALQRAGVAFYSEWNDPADDAGGAGRPSDRRGRRTTSRRALRAHGGVRPHALATGLEAPSSAP